LLELVIVVLIMLLFLVSTVELVEIVILVADTVNADDVLFVFKLAISSKRITGEGLDLCTLCSVSVGEIKFANKATVSI
jgi:hypothetical protein